MSTSVPTYAITIENSQSTATPSPFQQLLTLDLSDVISSADQLLNLSFYLGSSVCRKQFYAWIENYNSNFSTVNIWVNLPIQIPADSSITIYMSVQDQSMYPYTGINAYYNTSADNGALVFDGYLNAMGTSIVSTSTPQISSNVYSSIQFTPESGSTPGYITTIDDQTSSRTAIYMSAPNSARLPEIFEGMSYYDGSADAQMIMALINTSSSTFTVGVCGGIGGSNFGWSESIIGAWDPYDNGVSIAGAGDSTLTCSTSGAPFNSGGTAYNFYQLVITSSGVSFNGETSSQPYIVNYSSISSIISYCTSFSVYGNAMGFEDSTGGAYHVGRWYWVRARGMPPNNTMPSVTSFTQIL